MKKLLILIFTMLMLLPVSPANAVTLSKRCSTTHFGSQATVRACVFLEKSWGEQARRGRLRIELIEGGWPQVQLEFRRVRLIRKGQALKVNSDNKFARLGGTDGTSKSMGTGWFIGCKAGSANWWADGRYRMRLIAPGWDWTPVYELTTPKDFSLC